MVQDQLKELLLDIRGDDPATGFMSYERVERALARMLETQRREMARDSEDKIIAAFRALDPEVCAPQIQPLRPLVGCRLLSGTAPVSAARAGDSSSKRSCGSCSCRKVTHSRSTR